MVKQGQTVQWTCMAEAQDQMFSSRDLMTCKRLVAVRNPVWHGQPLFSRQHS